MIHRFASTLANNIVLERYLGKNDSTRSDIDRENSLLQIYDPESRDLELARKLADECINISGAPIKVYVRTDNAAFDAVWDEDPDPTYWTPFELKGVFRPQPLELELKKWGPEAVNKTDVSFSHQQVYELLGERMLRAGDVLQLPYNAANIQPKNYRILNAGPTGAYKYTWLYLTCQVETLTADIAVRPEDDLPDESPTPPEGGRYLESADN